jgi:hypothetical protein
MAILSQAMRKTVGAAYSSLFHHAEGCTQHLICKRQIDPLVNYIQKINYPMYRLVHATVPG